MIKRKLLCATDGSHNSDKAVAYAIEVAKTCGAELALLAVDSVTSEKAAQTYFWDSKLLDAGIACVTTNGRDIAEAIVAYAEAHGYDHIVLGSAGRTGLNRLMLGSVAQAVVAKAHCPVTVVR